MTVKEFAEYVLKNFDNEKESVFQNYDGDSLLDEIKGYIIGGIGIITAIVTGGRVADDAQMGINYKPGLDKDNEE